MNVSFEINTTTFEAGMQRIREGVRRGIIDPQYGTLPVQARLLAERCQEFTPPMRGNSKSKASAWATGKAAVAMQITRAYRPLSHTTFEVKRISDIVKADDRPAWTRVSSRFRGNTRNLKNTIAIGFSKDWHKQNRVSRGRVRGMSKGKGKSAKDNLGVVTLGAEGTQVRAYIEEKKKMVGWAKAGWNAGIIGFGGSVDTNWIAKHGTAGGWFQNGMAQADPFVSVGSSTSWARYDGTRIIKNAINSRARDMQHHFFQAMRVAAAKAQGAPA